MDLGRRSQVNGLGCGGVKIGVADNGNEALLPGENPGRNWISTDHRGNSASTVSPAKLLRHAGRRRKYAAMWDLWPIYAKPGRKTTSKEEISLAKHLTDTNVSAFTNRFYQIRLGP